MTEQAAFHEAGHAWAYWRGGKPLRYVTIRPRGHGLTGICRPWRPRPIDAEQLAWIASAGPVAEAMWAQRTEPDDCLEWDDYLGGAVLSGGHDDLAQSMGMLDSLETIAHLRGLLEHDWPAISDLAHELKVRKTVVGREAFDRLADHLRTAEGGTT